MARPGEEGLPRRLAAGEEEAFTVLYDRYAAGMYRYATKLLGNKSDAEDAVQEVFLSMARSRKELGKVRNLSAYLFTSLYRRIRSMLERRKRLPIPSQASVEEAWSARQDPEPSREILELALARLPIEQRQVVALKIDGGLTFEGIGRVLNIPPGTAASRYRYALEKLRRTFKESLS